MIYTLTLLGISLLFLGIIWKYRLDLLEFLPSTLRSKLRHYAPLQTFEAAMEAGKFCFHIAVNSPLPIRVISLIHHQFEL